MQGIRKTDYVVVFSGGPMDGNAQHGSQNSPEDDSLDTWYAATRAMKGHYGIDFEIKYHDTPPDEHGTVWELARHVYKTESSSLLKDGRAKVIASYVRPGPIRILRSFISPLFTDEEQKALSMLLCFSVYKCIEVYDMKLCDFLIIPNRNSIEKLRHLREFKDHEAIHEHVKSQLRKPIFEMASTLEFNKSKEGIPWDSRSMSRLPYEACTGRRGGWDV